MTCLLQQMAMIRPLHLQKNGTRDCEFKSSALRALLADFYN